MLAFYWERVDRWLEEDEEIVVHPRDPYPPDRRARDQPPRAHIARGTAPGGEPAATALFESSLPPRWYLPRDDVVAELLPSDTVTRCGYKGQASYYSVALEDDETVRDLAWTYTHPLPEAAGITDLICFFNERVDLELDGGAPGAPHVGVEPRREV